MDESSDMPHTERGLIEKYKVSRLDGKPVGNCIVLEFSDKNNWPALSVWADNMKNLGYLKLSQDVTKLLDLYMNPEN